MKRPPLFGYGFFDAFCYGFFCAEVLFDVIGGVLRDLADVVDEFFRFLHALVFCAPVLSAAVLNLFFLTDRLPCWFR